MNAFQYHHPFSIIPNRLLQSDVDYPETMSEVISVEAAKTARDEITTWPGYTPTELVPLPGLAKQYGIGEIFYKDEGSRFGLGSFKPLGGAYAVFHILCDEIFKQSGLVVTSRDLIDGKHSDMAGNITVCAASDGNHGRSVAWGAHMFGCRCVIFLNEAVSPGREQAITALGAKVKRVKGSFDDAVRASSITADQMGWFEVPDTAAGGNVASAKHVMQGYALLAHEIGAQMPDKAPPSHLFVQAGVGGLAAAVTAGLWQIYGSDRPKTITVEPDQAGCWYASIKAGHSVIVDGDIDSLMAGLSCGEISPLAWQILATGASAAMTIPDAAAMDAMRVLADGKAGDRPIVGGESGVAGLAGLLLAAGDDDARAMLGLDENSRVIVIGSEGDTDPETYREIIGRSGDEIRNVQI